MSKLTRYESFEQLKAVPKAAIQTNNPSRETELKNAFAELRNYKITRKNSKESKLKANIFDTI